MEQNSQNLFKPSRTRLFIGSVCVLTLIAIVVKLTEQTVTRMDFLRNILSNHPNRVKKENIKRPSELITPCKSIKLLPAKIREQIWSCLDLKSLIALRTVCKLFLKDVNSGSTLPLGVLDDKYISSRKFIHSVRTRTLVIGSCSRNLADDLNIVPEGGRSIRKIIIKGPITPIKNFWTLFRQLDRVEFIQISVLPSTYTFPESGFNPDTDVFACSLLKLKTLKLQCDQGLQLPLLMNSTSTLQLTRAIQSAQICTSKILGGLRAPSLTSFACDISFFDVDTLETALKYADTLFAWLQLHSSSLKEFKVSLSLKSGVSFVEASVALQQLDDLHTEIAKCLGVIPVLEQMKNESQLNFFVNKNGFKTQKENNITHLQNLKLIWDYLTLEQAISWLQFAKAQINLSHLSIGFLYPVHWNNYFALMRNCSRTLVNVALYNLAVWECGSNSFQALDLKMFEGCHSLKSLQLSLSVFQDDALFPKMYKEQINLVNVLLLPKNLAELSLTRFTVRTDQLISLTVGLPKLRALQLSYIIHTHFLKKTDMGLTPEAFLLIWGMERLRKIHCMDFTTSVTPLVKEVVKYLKEGKDLEEANKLEKMLASHQEDESFEFVLFNNSNDITVNENV